jgi:hypothetical protein
MALARQPRPTETQVLGDLYQRDLAEFREDRARAMALVSIGKGKPGDALDAAEWAAWTGVCRAVLNLHESIMRY